MSSNKNDLFGSLFDLNGDGKTSIDEEYMAFQIMNQCNKKDSENRNASSHHYMSQSTPTESSPSLTEQKVVIPETLSKENYAQRKSVEKSGIVSAIIAGLALSLIPIVLIWATVSTYDENNSANWLVLLLFGGGGLVVLGIIWHSAISSISKCYHNLRIMKQNYRKFLTDDELLSFDKKKRKKRIIVWSIIGAVVAGLIALSAVNSVNVSTAYNKAVLLAENGSYKDAKECFEEIEEKNYHDTSAYIALCKAHINYDKGYISDAYYNIKDVCFNYLTSEQAKAIDDFTASLKDKYDEYLKKKADSEAKAYRERITHGVPYVGMSESEIKNTSLGAPSSNVRHNYECISGEQYLANLYDFKSGNKTIFTARCVRGRVTEVWDHRSDPIVSYTPKKNTQSNTDDDPYDVNDYSNEEDFYYDHYDDFFDYYDAEDYYNKHHK